MVKGNVRRKFCESYLNRCHHSHACVMRFGKALCLLTTHCMELCTYCSAYKEFLKGQIEIDLLADWARLLKYLFYGGKVF